MTIPTAMRTILVLATCGALSGSPACAQGCDHPQPPQQLARDASLINASPISAMGWSIDADDQTVIMGDPYFEDAEGGLGHIQIFRRAGSDWVREASVVGPASTQTPHPHGVGICVGVDGDLAAAIGDGAMMVFRRVAGPDGQAKWSTESWTGAYGPARVRVHQGRFYVRTRSGIIEGHLNSRGTWVLNVVASNAAVVIDGADNGNFAVDGDLVVDGLPGLFWGTGGTPGVVSVYRRDGYHWTFETALPDRNAVQADHAWGKSVAVNGDTIAVGNGSSGPEHHLRYVRVFRRSADGTWNLEADLECPTAGAGVDSFARSLALSGDRLAVGAPLDEAGGPDSGAVHVFQRDGQTWRPAASYAISDSAGGNLGWNVAFSGADIVGSGVGLFGDGGAAVFDTCSLPANGDSSPRCLPGLTGLLAFLDAYFSGSGFADYNRSGAVSVQDLLDYLGAWMAGCP